MNTKKILAVGTLLLSCSLFVVAENAVAPDQVDLSSTPCQCLMYKGINPQTPDASVTPASMASPTVPLRNDDDHSGNISYSEIVPVR